MTVDTVQKEKKLFFLNLHFTTIPITNINVSLFFLVSRFKCKTANDLLLKTGNDDDDDYAS